jgi:hypothetical protein
MDETALRELLDHAAQDYDAPPCQVSVLLARRRGRRRLRLLRMYLPSAAPVAAAIAVALVITLPAGLRHGSAGAPGIELPKPAAPAPIVAPHSFNPLVPYASFGWLPAGFSDNAAAGVSDESTGTSVTLQALAPATDGRMVVVSVDAASACRLGPASSVSTGAPSIGTLTCRGAADGTGSRSADLVRVAPDVNGRPAYWSLQGGLEFEYAAGAWAEVLPMANPAICVHCAPNNLAGWSNVGARPARTARGNTVSAQPAVPQSAASRSLLLTVASSLRYGDTAPLVFGFKLTGLPAGWNVTDDYYFAPQAGRLAASGLSAGPAVDPTALGVSIGPAVSPTSAYACKVIPGQTSPVLVDGAPALVRDLSEPDKQFQSLCANDIDGVSPYVALDLNAPGSNAPLPGGAGISSVLTLFQGVRLLGPDPAAWTTDPVG